METLARINREDGTTVVVSLHQVEFAVRYCPRAIALKSGRVVFDGPSRQLTPELLRELYGADADEIAGWATDRPETPFPVTAFGGTAGLGIATAG